MTDTSARAVATVVLGTVAAGAACYIVRTPPLRRLAWRLVVATATVYLPAWLKHEVRDAWAASAPGNGTAAQFTDDPAGRAV